MRIAVAFAALAALAACSQNVSIPPGYEAILGSWRCVVDQPGVSAESTTQYFPDGRLTTAGRTSMQAPNRTIDISGVGRWKIEGNVLTETAESMTITSATIDGAPVPPGSPQHTQMKAAMDGMKGLAIPRTIISVTQTALTVSSMGQQLVCTRP